MATHSGQRIQLTIALSLVLLGLLSIIAWMELGGKNAGDQATASIDSIVITRKGHDDISLVRDASMWRMTAPFSLRANALRIEPLLNLGQSPFSGYALSEVDLPATGLSQPEASISFDGRTFLLGNTDVDDERRYTMVDEQVGFVPAWVWSLVHGGVTAFADLTVFEELPDELYLVDGDSVRKLDNRVRWTSLQADKVVAWPGSFELGQKTSTGSPRVLSLRTSSDVSAGSVIATMVKMSDFTAIVTQSDFAFAISNARLDTLLNP